MSIVDVSLSDLLRVLPFKGDQDIRYYLNGVLVSPLKSGGAMLVATNGHVLGAIESPEARVDQDRILDISGACLEALQGLQDAPTRLSIDTAVVIVDTEDSRLVVSDQTGDIYIKPGKPFIDGRFPDWLKAVPPVEKLVPGLLAPLQPKYIDLIRQAQPRGREKSVMFWHNVDGPLDRAVVCRYHNDPHFVVSLMPVRHDRPESWPDWIPREPKPAESAA